MSLLHTVIIDKLEEMGCATAGYMCGYWYPSIIINRMCRPTPHQLSCVVSFPVLISQVPCTSCASTTWPGWNLRRILFGGLMTVGSSGFCMRAPEYAGQNGFNIGFVCEPWTVSWLQNCGEMGLRVRGSLQFVTKLHAKGQGHISDIW